MLQTWYRFFDALGEFSSLSPATDEARGRQFAEHFGLILGKSLGKHGQVEYIANFLDDEEDNDESEKEGTA